MEGHAQARGSLPQTFAFAGKKYTLSAPFRVGTYEQMERYIISLRADPLAIATEACRKAPRDMHATIWEAALRRAEQARVVTQDEVLAFETSMLGFAWKAWYCLQDHHKDEFPTPADALRLLEQVAEANMIEELQAKVSLVSGEHDVGNSSGPSPAARAKENAPAPAAGLNSTSSLQSGMASVPTS